MNTTEFTVSINSCLLLTQHFANLNIISWSQQKEIYSIIIDYFTDNNTQLIIKTHPADVMDYENIFKKALIIRDSLPSELLPFLFKVLPNSIITVSSTAINLIGEFFKDVYKRQFTYLRGCEGEYIIFLENFILAQHSAGILFKYGRCSQWRKF